MMDYSGIHPPEKIPEFPDSFRFDHFVRNGRHFGRIAEMVQWQTEVKGFAVRYNGHVDSDGTTLWVSFELFPDGVMNAYSLTEYDFGSGPAIDDLCVIYSSLPHDIGCHLTNMGLIPWKWRKYFDGLYSKALSFYGCPWWRKAYQWTGVRLNSKFVAYWKAEK